MNSYNKQINIKVNGKENNPPDTRDEAQWDYEEMHLKKCLEIIGENIDLYSKELRVISAETKELYDNYRSWFYQFI
ncbi:MAG: hypothetical protein GX271_08040 [Clostridiales bacterium]|nr:hypothetical protein [Clostridiales bacterium]